MKPAVLKGLLLSHKLLASLLAVALIGASTAVVYNFQSQKAPGPAKKPVSSLPEATPQNKSVTDLGLPSSGQAAGETPPQSSAAPQSSASQTPKPVQAGDTQAPSVPQDLTVVLSQYGFGSPSAYVVSWLPSTDNVKVAGYVLYRQKVGIDFTTNHYTKVLEDWQPVQTIDDGSHDTTEYLSCGFIYYYKVLAYDQAGNQSAFSNMDNANATSCYAG